MLVIVRSTLIIRARKIRQEKFVKKNFMTQLEHTSTRNLRSSRSASPASQQLEPTEPLTQQELSRVAMSVRQKLITLRGENPALSARAVFRRNDSSTREAKTVHGKIREEGIE